jgi:hypothetical protein
MSSKKELQEAYKQKKFKMGVFQIRNTENQKVFIEGSVNLDAIWNRHRLQLSFGNHPNAALQADWKTFGEHSFLFEIIEELTENDQANTDYNKEVKLLSQMCIDELKPYGEKGYHKNKENN